MNVDQLVAMVNDIARSSLRRRPEASRPPITCAASGARMRREIVAAYQRCLEPNPEPAAPVGARGDDERHAKSNANANPTHALNFAF
jgi:hypothetical protein